MNTPNPTAEQVVFDVLAGLKRGMGVQQICDALRAHGLLSEGAPSEEQIVAALNASVDWGPQTVARMRAALTAAGVAPQGSDKDLSTSPEHVKNEGDSLHVALPALDPEKVAEWLGSDEPRKSRDETYGQYDRRRARALCEADAEGKLR